MPTPEAPRTAPNPLPAAEVRRRFLAFFAERGHTVVPSASLIPAGDQTLLFTNSGMVQFKEVFTGAEKRSYTRAVDVQRCLRVAGKHNDFEEVGRSPRHHTLFEMMGNWSFGDYFKREAIHWAWEFLTKELGIPGERLAATTYSDDEVAWAIWRDEIGLPPERMARWGDVDAGDDKNFWRMADTGPCGPCSELHFDRGAHLSEGPECVPDHSETCPRWVEVWNLVFMEFNQLPDGPRVPLPFPSVDTGLGLERLVAVLQGVLSNYDTDLFTPIHETLRRLLGHDPEGFEAERFSYQVIADHSRAITFLVADGVLPSNEGRGYVLRRILRRAVRHGRLLGRREPFLVETVATVIDVMADAYPYLRDERERVLATVAREEAQFARTLDAGTVHLEEALIPLTGAERVVGRRPEDVPDDAPVIPGAVAFKLHDTYGFPVDLTVELAAEYGVRVDRPGFEAALAEQRERSRGGRKAELARHAELLGLYESILRRTGDTAFLGYDDDRGRGDGPRDRPRRGRLRRADRPRRGRGDPRPDAVLRRGRRPGRRPRRPARGRRRLRALHRRGHAAPDRRPRRPSRDAPRAAARRRNGRGRRGRRSGAPGRCATTRRRTSSTAPCATSPGRRRSRPARSWRPTTSASTTRSTAPSPTRRSGRSRTRSAGSSARTAPSASPSCRWPRRSTHGADAFFDEKYGETVRTIRVQDYSFELCGGTHCRASGQIGSFVITGERSIGSGMRRIEALTGDGADAHLRGRALLLDAAAERLGAQGPEAVLDRIAALEAELKEAKRRLREGGSSVPKPGELAARAEEVAPGVRLVAASGAWESIDAMKAAAKEVRAILASGVIALALDAEEPQLFVSVSR